MRDREMGEKDGEGEAAIVPGLLISHHHLSFKLLMRHYRLQAHLLFIHVNTWTTLLVTVTSYCFMFAFFLNFTFA